VVNTEDQKFQGKVASFCVIVIVALRVSCETELVPDNLAYLMIR
jgi:hypothetical protein